MTRVLLPPSDHLARYVRRAYVLEDGTLNGAGFVRRQGETGMSGHWLEELARRGFDPISEVRRLSRMQLRPRDRFAVLPVQAAITAAAAHMGLSLEFESTPEPATDQHPADPSHAEVLGMPEHDTAEAEALGDLLARCVTDQYLAVS